ncbi:MAG: ComF family protein, partial [Chitinophagaceae bacterium]
YNQATILCQGMAEIINVPINTNCIIRKRATETQTKKGRGDRWQNVAESFEIQNQSVLENKNILLVDDVITTGATIDACGQALRKIPGIGISLFTLAYAAEN